MKQLTHVDFSSRTELTRGFQYPRSPPSFRYQTHTGNTPMNVTLNKALRIKNELASVVSTALSTITRKNRKRVNINNVNAPKEVDCKLVLAKYKQASEQMMELKTKISIANQPIISELVRVEELKSAIASIDRIDCDPVSQIVSKTENGITTQEQVFGTVDISEEEKELLKKDLKQQLDAAYDVITTHNAVTTISLSFSI